MSDYGVIYNIQRMSVHDGPGIRTTVFFKGCPLRCLWCSNPESQAHERRLLTFSNLCTRCGACASVCRAGAVYQKEDGTFGTNQESCIHDGACAEHCPTKARVVSGKTCSVEEIMSVVKKDGIFYRNSGGGVTFGGGECTSQASFLLKLLEACAAEGFHTCVDTCGHAEHKHFCDVAQHAELMLFDLKHMDPDAHHKLTGVDNHLILHNLERILSEELCTVRIRMPLIPDMNDSEENIAAMADFLNRFNIHAVEVMPYHTFGSNKYAALDLDPPQIRSYEPSELQNILGRFERHGLAAQTV